MLHTYKIRKKINLIDSGCLSNTYLQILTFKKLFVLDKI